MNRPLSRRDRVTLATLAAKAGLEALASRVAPSKRLAKPSQNGRTKAQDKIAKKGKHNEQTWQIRAAVWERSGGRCENPRCGFLSSLAYGHLDHWRGGSGRRRTEQAVENCWRLCGRCDRERTVNFPSTADWNARFKAHCERYGYAFAPHIEHTSVPRRSA